MKQWLSLGSRTVAHCGQCTHTVWCQHTHTHTYTHTRPADPLNPLNLLTCLQAAESLFERDGDFLVRDSSSAPGDYVLSCFWKNGPMHFKIIRVILRPKKVCLSYMKWGIIGQLLKMFYKESMLKTHHGHSSLNVRVLCFSVFISLSI